MRGGNIQARSIYRESRPWPRHRHPNAPARGIAPQIVVANDYRDYSLAIKQALTIGLMQAGISVKDIGPALSPMAYFSQFHLDVQAVAMVTASHNPNGWTGVKMGLSVP